MGINLGSSAVSLYLGDQAVNAYLGEVLLTATVPGAPTGLADYNASGLYWTAPEDDGGSEITGYKVYVTGTGDDSETYSDTDVTDRGTFIIPSEGGGDIQWQSDSLFGVDLVWQVSAVNAIGEGAKSTPPLTATLA